MTINNVGSSEPPSKQPIMKGENEQSSADCEWLEVSGSRWENDC